MIFLTSLIPNIPHDKQGHFIAGVLAYAAMHFASTIIGIAVVIAMAIGKEIYDWYYRENHTPEVWDAVATILGGVLAYLCGIPPFF